MVTEISMNGDRLYSHTAWAQDMEGAGFSLTEFDGALYVGNYIDTLDTDSTDPEKYTWSTVDESTDEEVSSYDEVITEILDQSETIEGELSIQAEAIEGTQSTSDLGLGNLNELIGTNRGLTGWNCSAGLTLSEQTESIYLDTDDPVKYLTVTCNTEGENYISFAADHLREKLASDTEDNAYTLSLDVRMSELFTIGTVAVQNTDGTARQIAFDEIDNHPSEDLEEIDTAGLWMHHSSTADVLNENEEPVPQASQVLYFDLSAMPQGSTLSIANLKIESGALATPWRAGLAEIEAMASEALEKAEGAENVALHYITDTTDGIIVHPEGDNTTGWSIRTALELIKSSVSYIKAWIDGVIPKVRIGIENAGHILIDNDSVDVNDGASTVASFSGQKIELGKNSESSEIELCDARGKIRVDDTYGIGIHSEDSACLRSTIESTDEQDETYKDSRVWLDSMNEGLENTMASISAVSRSASGAYQAGEITMAQDAPGTFIVADPQPDQATFEEDPTLYYIADGEGFIECDFGDEYDPNTTYYVLSSHDDGSIFITQDRARDLDFASAAIRLGTSQAYPYIDLSIVNAPEELMYERPAAGTLSMYIEEKEAGMRAKVDGQSVEEIELLHDSGNATDTFFRTTRDDTGVSAAFGIGTGGVNHGIWSGPLNAWMIYGNDANVYLNANVVLNATRLTTGTMPAARLPVMTKIAAFTSAAQAQNANSGSAVTIKVTPPTGYDFVGVVGFTCTHNQAASVGGCFRNSATSVMMITTNRSSSKWTDQKCTAYCLFVVSNAF